MKRIILGTVILLVVLIAAIVSCALISYHKQPKLTVDEIKRLDEQGIWKEWIFSLKSLENLRKCYGTGV